MRKSIVSSSSLQTKNIAKVLAKTILGGQPKKGATIVALAGELGSGKTTFAQGFAKGLGVKEKILSPTFILIRSYTLDAIRYKLLYHIDCYRLDNPMQELLHLGLKNILADPKNILVVEWANRIKKILPRDALWITFHMSDKNARVFSII